MSEQKDSTTWFKRFLKTNKTKIIIGISFVLVAISLNVSFIIHQKITPHSYFINVNDVDRLTNGSTIIQVSELQTAMQANKGKSARWNCFSGILEVNKEGEIIWEYVPNALIHHVDHELILKNGGYFFCDSFGDAIKFVRKSSKEVEWSYKIKDINWTKVNSSWGADHYYNLPCEQWNMEECIDWSHLNDIDFKNYGSWESMLVSIRNFNLIIEVNYTRAKLRDSAVAEDIIWYYRGALAHQHNPDYLPNGNIVVVDSDNQRLIEVNKTTKEIVWEWNHPSLTWPRDCDLMPDNRYLITDIDKAIIMNRSSGEVLQTFSPFFGGYEADYLEETDTILVSCGTSGVIFEYDITSGKKVWKWGTNVNIQIVYSNCILFLLFEIFWLLVVFQLKAKWRWAIIVILTLLIGLGLFIMIAYYQILVKVFVRFING
ncbi:MAG: hypothetical protein GF308_09130 [Candidatus Heimdallarchaeota archaeon]|nr:hypothetical protein [Candidatus Heimdallarchaeota archaeon]